jgi:hypothetical protein
MVTELPRHQLYMPYLPMKWLLADWLGRVPLVNRARVTNITGRERVEGVELTHLDTGRVEAVAADTLIFTGDWIPEHETARLGGLALDAGTRGPGVDAGYHTSRRGVFAAGNLLRGAETADVAALEGRAAARQLHAYLQGQPWPAAGLPLVAELPLAWICPNRVAPGDGAPAFRFQSRAFVDGARLEVRQGDRVLHRQTFARLIVNESMALAGEWVTAVQPAGGPIRLLVVQ